MRKHLPLVFGFAAILIVAWLLVDDRTRLTLLRPNGFIQSGRVLGVAVGDTRSSARLKLQGQGMAFQETQSGGTCFFRKVEADRQLDIFFVKSWHGGMVCIVLRHERVDELIWAFQPVSL